MKKKATIAITLILVSIFMLACTGENKTTISESRDNIITKLKHLMNKSGIWL